MAEYAILPREEPSWRLDPSEFAEKLRARWPGSRIGMGSVAGSTMALEALIPFDPPRRELGVALSGTGKAVTLDPADPDTAAEFACWYVRQVPTDDVQLHVVNPGSMQSFELTTSVTEDELAARLAGAA